MNKKGSPGISLVIALLLGIAVLILGVMLNRTSGKQVEKIDEYSADDDFDGDGKSNILDPCACGRENEKDTTMNADYCVAYYDEYWCGCANTLANLQMKDTLKKRENDPNQLYFIWKAGGTVGYQGTCYYTKEACKFLISRDSGFETLILGGQTPAGCPPKP